MTLALRFLPEVEEDAVAGFSWYEEKAPGLGESFLRVFYDAVREIPPNPLLYQIVRDKIRRRLLSRFPYAVYFTLEDETIIVIGLFHCARDPRYITAEVERREESDKR